MFTCAEDSAISILLLFLYGMHGNEKGVAVEKQALGLGSTMHHPMHLPE